MKNFWKILCSPVEATVSTTVLGFIIFVGGFIGVVLFVCSAK